MDSEEYRTPVRVGLHSMSTDLSYRLEMARRSLASTTRPDGSVELTKAGVVELHELWWSLLGDRSRG